MLRSVRVGPDTPVADQRSGYDLLGSMRDLADGVTDEGVSAGAVEGAWLRPTDPAPDRAVLYLHGGGYVIGSPTSHRVLASHLAVAARTPVFVVDYRLAPEHPFPAALDDAIAAYHFVLAGGVDAEGLVVAGDSAGGGLAAALCLLLRDDGARQPAGAVLLSPWTDLTLVSPSVEANADTEVLLSRDLLEDWAAKYAGAHPDGLTAPLVSPVYADVSALAPMLVLAAAEEQLRDDATRFATQVRAAGGDITCIVENDRFHVWPSLAGLAPEADHAMAAIGTWIEEVVH
jgi:acetyl esterase/lipase